MRKTAEELKQEIKAFAEFPDSWRVGYEIPPNEDTITCASVWVEQLCNLGLEVEVFPGIDNSVVISPRDGDIFIDIEISGEKVESLETQKGIGNHYDVLDFLENPTETQVFETLYNRILRINITPAVSLAQYSYEIFRPFPVFHMLIKNDKQCIYESYHHDTMTKRDVATNHAHLKIIVGGSLSSKQAVQKKWETTYANTSKYTSQAYASSNYQLASCV